jgi:hypothetical protein
LRRITAFRDVCLLGLGQTTEADATVRLLLYFPQHPEIAQPAGTAAQPFLSGAVSQTVNLPENAMDEDIMRSYSEAWQLGLKAVAIYHDGSKRSPRSTPARPPTWASSARTAARTKSSAPVPAASALSAVSAWGAAEYGGISG